MDTKGIQVKQDDSGSRVNFQCDHQKGVLYVIPSESNWVCSSELRLAHSLAGFLKELGEINDPNLNLMMRRWGIYTRNIDVLSESS
tara:strand:+ start:12285 stop:12542 length:258 start_codon:yes stop_codon:yes gene_type:complete